LAECIEANKMSHVRDAPVPSSDRRQDRTLAPAPLKNRILLENYFLPGNIEDRTRPRTPPFYAAIRAE